MEQKKTLWIALSAGVFLLVVLGAALVIYSPGARANTNAIAMRESGQVWTASLPNQSPSQGALIAKTDSSAPLSGTYSPSASSSSSGAVASGQDGVLKTDNVTVIADTANVYAKENVSTAPSSSTSVSYKTGGTSGSGSNVTAMNEKSELAIQETGNLKKVEESKPAKSSTAKASETAATSAKASSQVKASGTAKSGSASSAKSTATAKSSAASSSGSSKTTILPAAHYWVQVASYSTKDNADEARKVLDAKDLPCEVFTYTKDSKLYYRVRVGPYKTESEAEKWKKSVDAIDMFKTAQSYVVDSSARASR